MNVDLGAVSFAIGSAIFGAGWTAYHAIIGRELRARVTMLEGRLLAVEAAKDKRIADMEKELGWFRQSANS